MGITLKFTEEVELSKLDLTKVSIIDKQTQAKEYRIKGVFATEQKGLYRLMTDKGVVVANSPHFAPKRGDVVFGVFVKAGQVVKNPTKPGFGFLYKEDRFTSVGTSEAQNDWLIEYRTQLQGLAVSQEEAASVL